uniref:Uncharacterized protein n=1 Tax=viral metagenome TaxID=1070528 RepID=A0A6C0EDU8_9ZZZZ
MVLNLNVNIYNFKFDKNRNTFIKDQVEKKINSLFDFYEYLINQVFNVRLAPKSINKIKQLCDNQDYVLINNDKLEEIINELIKHDLMIKRIQNKINNNLIFNSFNKKLGKLQFMIFIKKTINNPIKIINNITVILENKIAMVNDLLNNTSGSFNDDDDDVDDDHDDDGDDDNHHDTLNKSNFLKKLILSFHKMLKTHSIDDDDQTNINNAMIHKILFNKSNNINTSTLKNLINSIQKSIMQPKEKQLNFILTPLFGGGFSDEIFNNINPDPTYEDPTKYNNLENYALALLFVISRKYNELFNEIDNTKLKDIIHFINLLEDNIKSNKSVKDQATDTDTDTDTDITGKGTTKGLGKGKGPDAGKGKGPDDGTGPGTGDVPDDGKGDVPGKGTGPDDGKGDVPGKGGVKGKGPAPPPAAPKKGDGKGQKPVPKKVEKSLINDELYKSIPMRDKLTTILANPPITVDSKKCYDSIFESNPDNIEENRVNNLINTYLAVNYDLQTGTKTEDNDLIITRILDIMNNCDDDDEIFNYLLYLIMNTPDYQKILEKNRNNPIYKSLYNLFLSKLLLVPTIILPTTKSLDDLKACYVKVNEKLWDFYAAEIESDKKYSEMLRSFDISISKGDKKDDLVCIKIGDNSLLFQSLVSATKKETPSNYYFLNSKLLLLLKYCKLITNMDFYNYYMIQRIEYNKTLYDKLITYKYEIKVDDEDEDGGGKEKEYDKDNILAKMIEHIQFKFSYIERYQNWINEIPIKIKNIKLLIKNCIILIDSFYKDNKYNLDLIKVKINNKEIFNLLILIFETILDIKNIFSKSGNTITINNITLSNIEDNINEKNPFDAYYYKHMTNYLIQRNNKIFKLKLNNVLDILKILISFKILYTVFIEVQKPKYLADVTSLIFDKATINDLLGKQVSRKTPIKASKNNFKSLSIFSVLYTFQNEKINKDDIISISDNTIIYNYNILIYNFRTMDFKFNYDQNEDDRLQLLGNNQYVQTIINNIYSTDINYSIILSGLNNSIAGDEYVLTPRNGFINLLNKIDQESNPSQELVELKNEIDPLSIQNIKIWNFIDLKFKQDFLPTTKYDEKHKEFVDSLKIFNYRNNQYIEQIQETIQRINLGKYEKKEVKSKYYKLDNYNQIDYKNKYLKYKNKYLLLNRI